MLQTLIDDVNGLMDDCNYHGLRRSIEAPVWFVVLLVVTIVAYSCGVIDSIIEAIRSRRDS